MVEEDADWRWEDYSRKKGIHLNFKFVLLVAIRGWKLAYAEDKWITTGKVVSIKMKTT